MMRGGCASGEMRFSSAMECVDNLSETQTKLHEITRRKEVR